MLAVLFVAGIQLTGTGSKPGHASAEDSLAQAFRSTQKRLQQSEPQEVDHGGVKFLPRKSIVKSLPVRPNSLNNIQSYEKAVETKEVKPVKPNIGFKENYGLQPYSFDNTEYDSAQGKNAPMLPPVYKPMTNNFPAYAAVQRGDQVRVGGCMGLGLNQDPISLKIF